MATRDTNALSSLNNFPTTLITNPCSEKPEWRRATICFHGSVKNNWSVICIWKNGTPTWDTDGPVQSFFDNGIFPSFICPGEEGPNTTQINGSSEIEKVAKI